MSLMKLFSGPTPEKLETKGDTLFASGQWGQAKQAYERALHKLEKTAESEPRQHRQLQDKIQQTCEALARGHQEDAMNYLDGGYTDEARAALTLALEISGDATFRDELTEQLATLNARPEADYDALETMPVEAPSLDDDRNNIRSGRIERGIFPGPVPYPAGRGRESLSRLWRRLHRRLYRAQ